MIASNAWLTIDEFDLTASAESLVMNRSVNLIEKTLHKPATDGDAGLPTLSRYFGVENVEVSYQGILDDTSGGNLEMARGEFGTSSLASFGEARTVGSGGIIIPSVFGEYTIGGAIGDVVPFVTTFYCSGRIVPGYVMAHQLVTATVNGTSFAVGATSVTQKLYWHLHVTKITVASGSPSLAIVHESSANGTYSDAVVRHTFTAVTTTTGVQNPSINGAVTDTNHRLTFTLSGGTGTYHVRAILGIR